MDKCPPSYARGKKSEDTTAAVISMLEENMRQLEEMEEEKIRMRQMHQDEKERLEEQMEMIVDQWIEQKGVLEAKVAEENEEMKSRIAEFQAESERLAREKLEITRSMDQFRAECEQKMAAEKAQMTLKTTAFQSECERRMSEKENQVFEEIAAVEAECERKMAEFRDECARLETEKAQASRKMEEFKVECEEVMLCEKQEMMCAMEEFRADCERKMQANELDMSRKTFEFETERERLEEERREMTRSMADFRAESEQKMAEEEAEMMRKTNEFREDCERKMREKESELTRKTAEFRDMCERLAEEKMEMMGKIAVIRAECEQLADEKSDMTRRMSRFRSECEEKMEEKEIEMRAKTREFRAECDRLEEEKVDMTKKMSEFRVEYERKMDIEKEEMAEKMDTFFAECEQTMAADAEEMSRQSDEFTAERDRLEKEKEDMVSNMARFRAEAERKMLEEEEEMIRKAAELRGECSRLVTEEKAAADRRLAETRLQTEEQLKTERQITANIMDVLHELPPLQAAIELGDLRLLDEELYKWRAETLPERFGDCKGVVEAVVNLARERLVIWRGVEHTWKEVLREVERLPGSLPALTQQSQRVFRTLKEAQLTKLDLRRSDPQALERICQVLLAWQQRSMSCSNDCQKMIVRKVVNAPRLGPFDFADLDICLRLVDRSERGSEVFLTRAQALVQSETTAPKDLKSLLSHVETMLFFLKYAKTEDLQLTHAEFRRQAADLEPSVFRYFAWAERAYPPGCELVRLDERKGLIDGKDVSTVLEELRRPRVSVHEKVDSLGPFREIFYQWAIAMRNKFDLLVLPHHTQVVCLLIFRRFLEAEIGAKPPHALIAQVGTGEGKSMIVAALAIYVVVALGKKAHVVVDDETLLERDFETFKSLFEAFELPAGNGARRRLKASLCVTEERLAGRSGEPHLSARVDPGADICYCEAKHVQSFYASIARGEGSTFDEYKDRVLILDEVDALVIDEEPNEAFVYPNKELSEMATSIAGAFTQGAPPEKCVRDGSHPAAPRVLAEMTREWSRGKQMVAGEDFIYAKETGRYCALQSGRANPKAWSLALECRNFQDGMGREILFQERLFVMSRPRVFRKYYRILGLSGSIGSKPERAFLKDTYRASFFEVPHFLRTCRGSPFHEAVPAPLGQLKQAVYLEPDMEAQITRLAEVAFEARERVPVLVVAKDRGACDHFVERLRQMGRSRGLGAASEDIIRSLSRTLYEADPEQWKENVNRATLPLGESTDGRKCWRVTVTDPRGGRGTDYRVDDQNVDTQGGLLLIPTIVPSSQRDWKQFLGRTARQDRKGQFCCVLCSTDYSPMSTKYKEAVPADGGTGAIATILGWGDRDASERIQGSAALYNCGVRVNELCEELFGRRRDMLKDRQAREALVDVCQKFRWMSVREVEEAFRRLPGFEPTSIPTESRDMGRPAEPPAANPSNARSDMNQSPRRVFLPAGPTPPKAVIFCLDWSASMMSRDTRTPLSRFETCVACVRQILRSKVKDCDLVGVVCFGPSVSTVVHPTPKGQGLKMLEQRIAGLRPQSSGGTCFYDAVAQCLQLFSQPGLKPAARWLVCLTDGDDLGSRPQNARGEVVNRMLETGTTAANLNMVMITVGKLQAANVQRIEGWAQRIQKVGGVGRHLPVQDAAAISQAFDVVAECLAAEVGGATEC